MRFCTGLFTAFLISAFLCGPASAQLPDTLSDSAEITMLTIVPGQAVYSRYGHTALRVHDRQNGLDLVYNYGTFDFEAPGFLGKFVYGATDYFLSVSSMRQALLSARVQNRGVISQKLFLSRLERQAAYSFLQDNVQPQNRTYRYHFISDNCATRPRDVLEHVVFGDIEWRAGATGPRSFRELVEPYVADAPLLNLGINLVFGSPTDREATTREEAFLPIDFMELIERSAIRDSLGLRPLAAARDTIVWFDRPAVPSPGLPWLPALGWAIFGLGAFLIIRRKDQHRLLPSDRLFMGLIGLVGVFLVLMGTLTLHDVTRANWNLLWALPSHLLVALFARRIPNRILAGYLGLSAVAALVSLAGGWLLPQPVPTALIPIVLLAAVRFGMTAVRLWTTQD